MILGFSPPEYRCTIGPKADADQLLKREAVYVQATCKEDAIAQMERMFPEHREFTAQFWKPGAA